MVARLRKVALSNVRVLTAALVDVVIEQVCSVDPLRGEALLKLLGAVDDATQDDAGTTPKPGTRVEGSGATGTKVEGVGSSDLRTCSGCGDALETESPLCPACIVGSSTVADDGAVAVCSACNTRFAEFAAVSWARCPRCKEPRTVEPVAAPPDFDADDHNGRKAVA